MFRIPFFRFTRIYQPIKRKTQQFYNHTLKESYLFNFVILPFIPSAFNEVKSRLICGVGNILRVYEMGQK